MKRLLFFCCLIASLFTHAQSNDTIKNAPVNGYGYTYKRLKVDSSFMLALGDTTSKTPRQIKFVGNNIFYSDNAGVWHAIASGGTGGTDISNIYTRNDSLFYTLGSGEYFVSAYFNRDSADARYYSITNPAGYLTGAAITGKVNYTDTTLMLTPYLHKADTSAMLTPYLKTATGDARYPLLSGSYNNPTWLSSLSWGKVTGTPNTLGGYGITDAYNLPTQTGNNGKALVTNGTTASWQTVEGGGISVDNVANVVADYGADNTGVTDATVAINTAIKTSGKKIIFFPKGRYLITVTYAQSGSSTNKRGIELLSGTTLMGEGDSTVLCIANNSDTTTTNYYYPIINGIGVSNCVITRLRIAGNNTGQRIFTGNPYTNPASYLDTTKFDDVCGIMFRSGSYNKVDNIAVDSCQSYGIDFQNNYQPFIVNSRGTLNGNGAFGTHLQSSLIHILNNFVTNNYSDNIRVEKSNYADVIGNESSWSKVISGAPYNFSGIYFEGSSHLNVASNYSHDNSSTGIEADNSFDSPSILAEFNTFTNNTVSFNGGEGLVVSNHATIIGNKFINNGKKSDSTHDTKNYYPSGILVAGSDTANIVVSGNQFVDTQRVYLAPIYSPYVKYRGAFNNNYIYTNSTSGYNQLFNAIVPDQSAIWGNTVSINGVINRNDTFYSNSAVPLVVQSTNTSGTAIKIKSVIGNPSSLALGDNSSDRWGLSSEYSAPNFNFFIRNLTNSNYWKLSPSGAITHNFNIAATAANQNLVALDMSNGFFNNGGYSGITNIGLRLPGSIRMMGNSTGDVMDLNTYSEYSYDYLDFTGQASTGMVSEWFPHGDNNSGYGHFHFFYTNATNKNALVFIGDNANTREVITTSSEGGGAGYDLVFGTSTGSWGLWQQGLKIDKNNASTTIGSGNGDASAELSVNSTTKGLLQPRMTTTQRTTISSPAEGLSVYDLTLHSPYVWNGTAWQATGGSGSSSFTAISPMLYDTAAKQLSLDTTKVHSIGYNDMRYQPLENQRLSTSNDVGFHNVFASNALGFNTSGKATYFYPNPNAASIANVFFVPYHAQDTLLGQLDVSTVARSGSYYDLTNKPTVYSFTGSNSQYTLGDGTYATLPVANATTTGMVNTSNQVLGSGIKTVQELSSLTNIVTPVSQGTGSAPDGSGYSGIWEMQNLQGGYVPYIGGLGNLHIGVGAGNWSMTGSANIIMATNVNTAVALTTGTDNFVVGNGGIISETTGSYNIALGYLTGSNQSGGSRDVYIGYNAGNNGTASSTLEASHNVMIGENSNNQNYHIGSYNTFLGYNSGMLETASPVGILSIAGGSNGNYGIYGNFNNGTYQIGDSSGKSPLLSGVALEIKGGSFMPYRDSTSTGLPSKDGSMYYDTAKHKPYFFNGTTYTPNAISHSFVTPTTGTSVAAVLNNNLIVNPSGSLAALTITLPSARDGDLIYLTFKQAITAITYSPASGSVVNVPTAATQGQQLILTYDVASGNWY